MDELGSITTSWGSGAGQDVDVRALRRYNRLLGVLLNVGE